jgi:hypothetical protein
MSENKVKDRFMSDLIEDIENWYNVYGETEQGKQTIKLLVSSIGKYY